MSDERVRSYLLRIKLIEKLTGENLKTGYSYQVEPAIKKMYHELINEIWNGTFFDEKENLSIIDFEEILKKYDKPEQEYLETGQE